MSALRKGAHHLPGALSRVRDCVVAGIDLREESVELELLQVERELRRGVDEVLLEDRRVRDGTGGRDVSHDGATNRIREAFEHALESFRRRVRVDALLHLRRERPIRGGQHEDAPFAAALSAHMAHPSPHVPDPVQRFEQTEVAGMEPSIARVRRSSSTARSVRWRASTSYGFSTKSMAPAFIASTAASIVPWPVTTTTAVSGRTTRRRWRTSRPDAFGIFRSRRATSNDSRSTARRASPPSAAATTS